MNSLETRVALTLFQRESGWRNNVQTNPEHALALHGERKKKLANLAKRVTCLREAIFLLCSYCIKFQQHFCSLSYSTNSISSKFFPSLTYPVISSSPVLTLTSIRWFSISIFLIVHRNPRSINHPSSKKKYFFPVVR